MQSVKFDEIPLPRPIKLIDPTRRSKIFIPLPIRYVPEDVRRKPFPRFTRCRFNLFGTPGQFTASPVFGILPGEVKKFQISVPADTALFKKLCAYCVHAQSSCLPCPIVPVPPCTR